MLRYAYGCKVEGCVLPFLARGYCNNHYSRFRKSGFTDPLFSSKKNIGPCKVDGCEIKATELQMCAKHAQRVRRYGDPSYITPEAERLRRLREAQPKFGKAQKHSYLKYYGRHEHRVVAEKMLGRPLRKGEIVHHQDHNKHNNDPSNLEVMTQS